VSWTAPLLNRWSVKENIDLAGTPTTQAVPALAEAVAAIDAPQVERLRAAGAIPLGRTNLPDFGLRVHTDSARHGLTRNPWNPQRTPGGSSGGEAAALATGMSPLGLGNDLGGSLRNPAHCCGVASIKPSAGAVPAATGRSGALPQTVAAVVAQAYDRKRPQPGRGGAARAGSVGPRARPSRGDRGRPGRGRRRAAAVRL
jgi:amidase